MENEEKKSNGLLFPVLFVAGVIILLVILKAII